MLEFLVLTDGLHICYLLNALFLSFFYSIYLAGIASIQTEITNSDNCSLSFVKLEYVGDASVRLNSNNSASSKSLQLLFFWWFEHSCVWSLCDSLSFRFSYHDLWLQLLELRAKYNSAHRWLLLGQLQRYMEWIVYIICIVCFDGYHSKVNSACYIFLSLEREGGCMALESRSRRLDLIVVKLRFDVFCQLNSQYSDQHLMVNIQTRWRMHNLFDTLWHMSVEHNTQTWILCRHYSYMSSIIWSIRLSPSIFQLIWDGLTATGEHWHECISIGAIKCHEDLSL